MCRVYFEGEEAVLGKNAPRGSRRGMEGERENAKKKKKNDVFKILKLSPYSLLQRK